MKNQKDLEHNVWVQQHKKRQMLSSALQYQEWRTKQQAVSQCVCVCRSTHQYRPVCMSYAPVQTMPVARSQVLPSCLQINAKPQLKPARHNLRKTMLEAVSEAKLESPH